MTGNRQHAVVAAALLVTLLVSVAAPVSAAGTTDVFVTPTESEIAQDETTTVDVVVGDANRGVGASELRVAVTEPSVASITNVTIRGAPSLTNVTYADDRSWVDVEYATANTTDSGDVPILTVTVEGRAAGSTDFSVLPRADNDAVLAFDERGDGYAISEVRNGTLTVTEARSGGGDGGGSGGGGGDSGASGGSNDDDSADSETSESTESTPEPTATETPDSPTDEEPTTSAPAESTTAPATNTETPESGPQTETTVSTATPADVDSGLPITGIAAGGGLVALIAVAALARRL